MTSGWISDDGHPLVTLMLVGDDGAEHGIDFLVDTGCEGQLILPSYYVHLLGLIATGETAGVTLAGGGTEDWPTYRANVLWNGQIRNVEILESDTPALLGMAMIYDPEAGHADRLTIDAADRSVLIEHNSPRPFTED